MLWIFKIFAVPFAVALATLAMRRWGPAVVGMLMGLPLMTGPISLFLALDQGIGFAVAALVGVLLAVAAMGPYAVAYYWSAPYVHWTASLALSIAAFAGAGWCLQGLAINLREAAVLAGASLLLALLLMPRVKVGRLSLSPPWWDLPFRMAVTAMLVVSVTALAERLGPKLSGIFGTLPIITCVVLSFTQQHAGPAPTRAVMRAISLSMLSFVVFFVLVGEAIGTLGIAWAYALATTATVGASLTTAMLDRWLARFSESRSQAITKALE
jgi:hypothetical protein